MSSERSVVGESIAVAKAVGLRWVNDAAPGIRRVPWGRGVRYLGYDGKPVRDSKTLARIRALVIPPAWTEVWIAPIAHGHIQATGRDAKRRKQYIYHPRWREVRDEAKYDKLTAFARALPKIRRVTAQHLRLRGLPREKVLAAVVYLLELTRIRVGNEEYARENGSYGLTTLRSRHVAVHGSHIRFHFKGKSGKVHMVDIADRRLARIIAQCTDLPGQELFQYVDEAGELRAIESVDVNEYLRSIAGQEFTAKDFRTWAGTLLAAGALRRLAAQNAAAVPTKKSITEVVKAVAQELGNTPAVCRKCYVHPAVFEAYTAVWLCEVFRGKSEEKAIVALIERSRYAASLAA